MQRALVAVIVAASCFGCGGSEHADYGPLNPGPGDQVDLGFVDQEPNNTPDEATPLGVASGPDVTVWIGDNAIGGSDDPADYFVFESGPSPGTFAFDMCYAPAVTGMTATLWKVVDAQQQTPPIATWTIGTSCSTGSSAPLEASTVYLFGVLATGGPGFYTA